MDNSSAIVIISTNCPQIVLVVVDCKGYAQLEKTPPPQQEEGNQQQPHLLVVVVQITMAPAAAARGGGDSPYY
jgi:hypothetical protein